MERKKNNFDLTSDKADFPKSCHIHVFGKHFNTVRLFMCLVVLFQLKV